MLSFRCRKSIPNRYEVLTLIVINANEVSNYWYSVHFYWFYS